MIRIFLCAYLCISQAFAGFPPTTSKVSSDANNVTTFNFQFPNFTGTHTGTTIALGVNSIAGGGTGQATKAAAFDALSPMTTGGDIIYGGASGTGTRLPNGSNGQYLTSSGGTGAPTWTTGLSNPLTTTGDIIYGVGSTPTRLPAGTSGYILQTLGSTLAPIWIALSSIVGSITSNSTSTLRFENALFMCNSSSSVTRSSSAWLTVGNISSGACNITIPGGVYSVDPVCIVGYNGPQTPPVSVSVAVNSNVSLTADCDVAGAACSTWTGNLYCFGQR